MHCVGPRRNKGPSKGASDGANEPNSGRNAAQKAGGNGMSGGHKSSGLPSVNTLVEPLVKAMMRDAAALRVDVSRGSLGECLIDCGVKAIGGVEAGRRMAEICLGGLGRVAIEVTDPASPWPFNVIVHTSQPVLACLASQYAGWSLSVGEKGKKYK